jgi:four helix bundle protein
MRRARSTKDFVAKLFVVTEECDEAAHWLSLLQATAPKGPFESELARISKEAIELRSIFAAARRTMRGRREEGN